ncbi:MAG: lipopolysaccharide heptosyltransferase II [Nitrospirae bacterium]|nr:lipopolysaccharide heptosyltransferase II [Nitrospirota bacterium]
MKDFRKILVIKPSSLGDVIHSMPFLKALKDAYPGAKVHWVISRGLYPLLEGHPLIDVLWPIDKDKWKKLSNAYPTYKELSRLRLMLKAEHFDLAVDLQGLFRSGLIAFLSGAPQVIGFKEAREGSTLFYTKTVDCGKKVHAVDRYLSIAAALQCQTGNPAFVLPEIKASESFHGPVRGYVVMVPGARWETKRWEAEKFGEVARRLPLPSVVVGGVEDVGLGRTVVAHSGGKAVNLAGKTSFNELAGIIGNAKLMLTNDTGPMHVGAAVGTPVFAIFGPTSPALTGPYGLNHRVITAGLSCAPCFRKKCSTKNCTRDLSFQSVYEIISQAI